MRAAASAVLPPAIKRRIKHLARAYQGRVGAFTPADLERALLNLGVVPGDVLMVHSAFDKFVGFQGGPVEAVEALQRVVGTGVTLVMPTIPFRTTAIEYALRDPVFDARRTVSKMGLITETFRRSASVVRSIHPTHSVAAWGSKAHAIVAGHERAETPCGRHTPYGRLLGHDGKILLAGVSQNAMTFCYFAAEELEPRLPVPVLTLDAYPLRWRDVDGRIRVCRVRLYSPRIHHDLTPVADELKRRKQWRERRVGGLPLVLLLARDVYAAAVALADSGMFVRERPGR